MARKKVNIQWISNNSTRRATYRKRCDGLMKKADELTTLCGIKACVVVYNDGEIKGESKPEAWPSDGQAKQLLVKFKEMPEVGSFKKTENQETFLNNHCSKLHKQAHKLGNGNHEDETLILLHDKMDGNNFGFNSMAEEKLVSLRKKVEMKMCKTKVLRQQLIGQDVLSEPPLVASTSIVVLTNTGFS